MWKDPRTSQCVRNQILIGTWLSICALMVTQTGCILFANTDKDDDSFRRSQLLGETSPRRSAPDDDGIEIKDLSPDRIGGTVKKLAGYGPDQTFAQQLYDEAMTSYQRAVGLYEVDRDDKTAYKLFLECGAKFKEAAGRWPESSLAQEALYHSGESYFFIDHYAKANNSYELLVRDYPGTRYLDLAQARRFAIANYWLDLNREDPDNLLTFNAGQPERPQRDTKGAAIRILNRMRIDDPTGKLADDATMALANAYFADERFLDAADTYEDLRITFPTSKHQYDAHFFEIRARIESYQGAAYDGADLEKADALLKQLVKQFPTEIDTDRAELERLAAKIQFKLAEREYKLARYYDSLGHYRSATIHYQQLVDQHADSAFADEARTRVAAIADKPDNPKQKAQWLVNMFPDPDKQKPLIGSSVTREALR